MDILHDAFFLAVFGPLAAGVIIFLLAVAVGAFKKGVRK